jgi:hypothetical protein
MSTTTATLRLVILMVVLASVTCLVSPTTTTTPRQQRQLQRRLQQQQQQPLHHMQRLSEIDEMCIENMAEYCLKAENALSATGSSECDVEEYQALVNQLRDQRAILASHVAYVDSLLVKLQAAVTTTTGSDDTATMSESSTAAQETYFAG